MPTVPPEALTVMLPVVAPVHLTSVEELIDNDSDDGWLTDWLTVIVQLFASCMVIV